jgi:hypothetical protein
MHNTNLQDFKEDHLTLHHQLDAVQVNLQAYHRYLLGDRQLDFLELESSYFK